MAGKYLTTQKQEILMMKRVLLAAGLLALGTSLASAADVQPPLPPLPPITYTVQVPPPDFNWSGMYIGVVGGYSFGQATVQLAIDPVIDFRGPEIGFLIGANRQIGERFVFGIEGDMMKSWEHGTTSMSWDECWHWGCNTYTQTDSIALDWVGTARLRAGFLITPRILAYGTVGVGFGMMNLHSITTGQNDWGNWLMDEVSVRTAGVGLTWGVGLEAAITERLSIRVEFRSTRLNAFDITSPWGDVMNANLVDRRILGGITYRF